MTLTQVPATQSLTWTDSSTNMSVINAATGIVAPEIETNVSAGGTNGMTIYNANDDDVTFTIHFEGAKTLLRFPPITPRDIQGEVEPPLV